METKLTLKRKFEVFLFQFSNVLILTIILSYLLSRIVEVVSPSAVTCYMKSIFILSDNSVGDMLGSRGSAFVHSANQADQANQASLLSVEN